MKNASVLFLLLSFLSAGLLCAGASAQEPHETAIADILKDPQHFNGQVLRVRGVIDRCERFSCKLCANTPGTLPNSDAACLKPEFDEMLGGKRLDEIFRYSELTVQGRYDWTCDGTQNADGTVNVCTDRATDFIITGVIAVHKRWPTQEDAASHH